MIEEEHFELVEGFRMDPREVGWREVGERRRWVLARRKRELVRRPR